MSSEGTGIDAIQYQGGGYEEVREWLGDYAVWVADSGEWGTDNGWARDSDGLPVGEPAVKKGDYLIRDSEGIVQVYRALTAKEEEWGTLYEVDSETTIYEWGMTKEEAKEAERLSPTDTLAVPRGSMEDALERASEVMVQHFYTYFRLDDDATPVGCTCGENFSNQSTHKIHCVEKVIEAFEDSMRQS